MTFNHYYEGSSPLDLKNIYGYRITGYSTRLHNNMYQFELGQPDTGLVYWDQDTKRPDVPLRKKKIKPTKKPKINVTKYIKKKKLGNVDYFIDFRIQQ